MTATTSRRALLGAAAAAPLAVALPTIAAASVHAPGIRPRFAAKLARYERLSRAHGVYEDAHLPAARARYHAIVAELPHTTAYAGVNYSGKRIVLSTESPTNVAVATSLAQKPIGDKRYMNACIKIASAHASRERAKGQASFDSGLAAVIAKSNKFGDVVAAAEWAFIRMRVASAPELALKVAFMIEKDAFGCDDAGEALLADAKALTGSASA